ncbi:MAG: hypothetical protein KC933_23150 [Myxococcales bacterium]|nr:hypothetical protein [Myxococcales bacterium]
MSLSYAGLHEVRGQDYLHCSNPIELADGRHVCATTPDVHSAAGMACIDCHLHTEIMGDGTSYAHEEQQTEVRCESCHGPADGLESRWQQIQDGTSRRLLVRNKLEPGPSERVRTGVRGTPLFNLQDKNGVWTLISKLGAGRWTVPQTPADAPHRLEGHERLQCATCHAAWTPTCPTCHTVYEPSGAQWDFGAKGVAKGAWKETAERFLRAPPVLAERGDRVVTAAPGMILDLEVDGTARHGRWFAAFDPHTTGKQARTCTSCHGPSQPLGLGTGTLTLEPRPRFQPEGPGPKNGPAQDGWQSLFGPPGRGTRPDTRGLGADAQRRVLRVAPCLECHPSAEDQIYRHFEANLERLFEGKASACKGRARPWMRLVTLR